MFFDALTIAAARDEMIDNLVPGRVQQVRAVGPLAIALEIYGNHRRRYLLLSAHPQYARAHLLTSAPSRDPGVRSPFLLLLRKYIRGAILQSIEQPEFERVLVFTFTKVLRAGDRDVAQFEDEGEEEEDAQADDRSADIPPGFALFETRLIAEIMGRHSNIVLVGQDGVVLEAVKRIPSSINRVRTILPHMPYFGPPAQRKLNLLTMGEQSFEAELSDLDTSTPLAQLLVARFRSVSPLLAQEAVFRAGGAPTSRAANVEPTRLYAALRGLIELADLAEWDPSLAWGVEREAEAGDREQGTGGRGHGVAEPAPADSTRQPATDDREPTTDDREPTTDGRQPLAFAPYRLTHLEGGGGVVEAQRSISRAAELFYAAAEQFSGHAQLKSDVLDEVRERQERLERRLRSLQIELDRAAGFEEVRRRAELLLAYQYVVEPGQQTLYIPEENLTISLSAEQTPLEQAQAMFREYQRARAAVAGVPERIETTRLALRYLDELATALDLAEDFDVIQAVRADIEALPSDPERLVAWETGDGRRETGDGRRETGGGKKGTGGRGQGAGKKGQRKAPGSRPSTPAARNAAPASRASGARPVQVKSRDGLAMLYGRSARENDALTFGIARPGDLWLHARGVPGAHVVIRGEGRSVPESTVAEAARLAARYSKARHQGAVDVVITERRHVRRIPGAPPGLVTYSGERVLRVRVEEPNPSD